MTKLTELHAVERDLEQRLAAVREQIREEVNYLGLNEKRIRADQLHITTDAQSTSGWGTNQPSAGVVVRHVPTGLSAHCDEFRSQHVNKHVAMKNLVELLELQGWVSEL